MSNNHSDSRSKGWSQGYHNCCNSTKLLAGDPDIVFINYLDNSYSTDDSEDVSLIQSAEAQNNIGVVIGSPTRSKVRQKCCS